MISETGFWNIEGTKFEHEHCYDAALSNSILDLAKKLDIKRCYDFGCGPGKYVNHLRDHGIEASGFDGNPITDYIRNCHTLDLTSNFNLAPVKFLTCLEVCEHVPKVYEDILLANIDKHIVPGGTLVLSWAIIGQGGFGHVNCQNNDYVINKISLMNYTYDPLQSQILRNTASVSWFKNTIMVFNKNA